MIHGSGLALLAILLAGCVATAPPSAPAATPPPVAGLCPIAEARGELPSSRLLHLGFETVGDVDRLTFSFDRLGSEPRAGIGRVREVRPPFAQGGSGEEVAVEGERFLEVRFEGVVVADESGNAVYQGPPETKLDLPAIAHVVVTEQFEGVITFVVGFRGRGCVALGGDPAPRTLTLDIGHG